MNTIGRSGTAVAASAAGTRPTSPLRKAPFGLAMAGLLFAGVLGRPSRKLRGVAGMLLLCVLTLALPGCGGGSSNKNNNNGANVVPGQYNLTVVGKDTSSSTISGSTIVSVTVNWEKESPFGELGLERPPGHTPSRDGHQWFYDSQCHRWPDSAVIELTLPNLNTPLRQWTRAA